jgi:hypothetical protein
MKGSPDTSWPAASTSWAARAVAREAAPEASGTGSLIKSRRAERARAPSVRRGGDSRQGSEHYTSDAISKRYKNNGQL